MRLSQPDLAVRINLALRLLEHECLDDAGRVLTVINQDPADAAAATAVLCARLGKRLVPEHQHPAFVDHQWMVQQVDAEMLPDECRDPALTVAAVIAATLNDDYDGIRTYLLSLDQAERGNVLAHAAVAVVHRNIERER